MKNLCFTVRFDFQKAKSVQFPDTCGDQQNKTKKNPTTLFQAVGDHLLILKRSYYEVLTVSMHFIEVSRNFAQVTLSSYSSV